MRTPTLAAASIGVLGAIACLGPIEPVRRAFFDLMMRQRPPRAIDGADSHVTIVGFDDASSARMGNTLSRQALAEAIDRIAAAGAKTIVLDIVPVGADHAGAEVAQAMREARALAVPAALEARLGEITARHDPDATLAAAIARPQVVAAWTSVATPEGHAASGEPPRAARLDADGCAALPSRALSFIAAPAQISARAPRSGDAAIEVDPDGVVRRYPLVRGSGGSIFPSLALAAAAAFLGDEPLVDCRGASVTALSLGAAERSGLIDDQGRVRVDFGGRFDQSFPSYVPLWRVLEPDFAPAPLRDRMVFIGARSDLEDRFVSPSGDSGFSGVGIHATVAATLLSGRGIVRRELPARLLEALVCLIAAGLVAATPLGSSRGAIPLAIAAPMAGIALTHAALAHGQLIDALTPAAVLSLALLASLAARFAGERQRRLRSERELGRFLSPAVVAAALENPALLAPRRRNVSVLFSDLRGFTAIAEKMRPEDVASFLEVHATSMTSEVFARGGMLDKYVGDALMAAFGAPADDADHARHACLAALDMAAAHGRRNAERASAGLAAIGFGIGIQSGDAFVGRMWEQGQSAYACIGDTTNTASRIEGLNKTLGTAVLVGDATRRAAGSGLAFRRIGPVTVKGRAQPIDVSELLGAGASPEWIATFERARDAFGLSQWDAALAGFREVIRLRGTDGPSEAFLARIDRFRGSPPVDWDGSFAAEEK